MHTLRGVQLTPVTFYPRPVRDQVALPAALAIEAPRVVLGARLTFELPAGDLFAPEIEGMPAALEKPWMAAEPLLPRGAGPAIGGVGPRSGGRGGTPGARPDTPPG